MVVVDNLGFYAGVEKIVAASERQTAPEKEAPKVLPWVHVSKALVKAMYHGTNEEFLQSQVRRMPLALRIRSDK